MPNPKEQGTSTGSTFTQNEMLARIESILRFTTEELANSEVRADAFERLSAFESELLEQQRHVSSALENVQKYRDEIEKDWNKEKVVRETTLDLMAERMKELHETLRAQEYLLDYTAAEQKFLRELLMELSEKKKLSESDVESILKRHEKLLHDLSKKTKK